MYDNRSLFSDYYLSELARDDPHWKSTLQSIAELRDRIAEVYKRGTPGIEQAAEGEVEERLIRPVLRVLGHEFEVGPNVRSAEGTKTPDYAFFATTEDRQAADRAGIDGYWKHALSVGDAKAWDRSLDRRLKGPGDPFGNHNPSYQIDFYLRATDLKWGILTNGRLWRLYYRDLSYRLDVYYEVNLPELLKQDDEAFNYFAAFFAQRAFLPDEQGERFLDRAYKGSIAYATGLSRELKDNVYEALRLLTEGFLRFPTNGLTPADLDTVRENAFVVIYRLLFILYAEDRGFLPLDNRDYGDTYSLRALAREIAQRTDSQARLSSAASVYWPRLQNLFRMINGGDPALGIPSYNGGLFDESRHPELGHWRIGDAYLARAVEKLTRAEAAQRTGRGFVSYRELSIRELGSIYEGLLEHRPRIANEPMVVIRDDKTERVVAEAEAKGKRVLGRYQPGEVYLTLHRGERKATGSYYTPEYIVKYIVANAVGPLLEEKKIEGGDLIGSIQSIKVLDPAMGSGHFLVEATDFLARALVEALGGDPIELGDDDIRWARREVVERCIYGVDLNPMAVELAKLSLWLHTVSRDRPLNFLDHHLRCGNSVIGAWLKDLGQLPEAGSKGTKKKAKQATAVTTLEGHGLTEAIAAAVKTFHVIAAAPTQSVEDVHMKENAYQTARHALSRIVDIADAWTSVYFGNEVDRDGYTQLLIDAYRGDGDWPKPGDAPWLDAARGMGRDERRFFHWELEFPEVFFAGDGGPLQNAGFDGVIGNPPYDVIAEKEQEVEVEGDKEFYIGREHLEAALGGKLNFYRLFGALALRLCREDGRHGFIVPMALMGDAQAVRLRRYVLSESQLTAVEAFPQKDDPTDRVFEDAKLSTCVYILRRAKPSGPFALRIHPGRAILDTSPQVDLTRHDLALLDSEYLRIPSSPGTDARHVALAIALAKRCAGHRFGDVAPSQQGEVNLTTDAKLLSSSPVGPEVLRGAHLNRYEFNEQPKQGAPAYLHVKEFVRGKAGGSRAFDHRERRIGYQRGAAIDNWRRIIACVIEPDNFCSDTVNYIVRPELAFFFVLGLLNSSLFEWRFRLTSTNNHVNAYEVDALPLRPIAVAADEGTRENELGVFRAAYESALQSGDPNSLAGRLERHLPWLRSAAIGGELSDVVYDILAYLAEELTCVIRRKQAEARGFLAWLEGYLGLKTTELKSKTKIREYFALGRGWDELAALLDQNRGLIQQAKGIDITRREPREAVRGEYEASMARLLPLLRKIELTDRLIDLIVYRLYGLTDEEIAIVEARGKAGEVAAAGLGESD